MPHVLWGYSYRFETSDFAVALCSAPHCAIGANVGYTPAVLTKLGAGLMTPTRLGAASRMMAVRRAPGGPISAVHPGGVPPTCVHIFNGIKNAAGPICAIQDLPGEATAAMPVPTGGDRGQCGVSFSQPTDSLPRSGGSVSIRWTAPAFNGLQDFRRTGSGVLTLPDGSVRNDAASPYRFAEPGTYAIQQLCLVSVGEGSHYYYATVEQAPSS